MTDAFGRVVELDEQLHPRGGSPGSGTGQSNEVWSRTTYAYGPDDNVAQIVDPDGVTTALVHDRAGRRTAITRAGRTWQYGYDANSNLTSVTEPCDSISCALATTTIACDENDRPTSKILAQRNLVGKVLGNFAGLVLDEGTAGGCDDNPDCQARTLGT